MALAPRTVQNIPDLVHKPRHGQSGRTPESDAAGLYGGSDHPDDPVVWARAGIASAPRAGAPVAERGHTPVGRFQGVQPGAARDPGRTLTAAGLRSYTVPSNLPGSAIGGPRIRRRSRPHRQRATGTRRTEGRGGGTILPGSSDASASIARCRGGERFQHVADSELLLVGSHDHRRLQAGPGREGGRISEFRSARVLPNDGYTALAGSLFRCARNVRIERVEL